MEGFLKNTFVLSSGGRNAVGHNLVLIEYNYQVIRGVNPLGYIAVGTGSGNVTLTLKAMRAFGYAAPSVTQQYNADTLNGPLYIVKRAVIPAGVMVGQTITEVGFAYNDEGAMTTLSNLEVPIVKGPEEMEVFAVVYLKDGAFLVAGDNPLVECYLGEKLVTDFAWSAAATKFDGPASARAIPLEDREAIANVGTNPNIMQLRGPKLTDLSKPDYVMFAGDVPVIVGINAVAKSSVTNIYHSSNEFGVVNLPVAPNNVHYRMLAGGIECAISIVAEFGTGIKEEEFLPMKVRPYTKVVQSNDRRFIAAYGGKYLTVYYNDSFMIKAAEELVFANNISHVAFCCGYLMVVCNYRDTVGADVTAKRLYKYYINGLSVSTVNNNYDIDFDIDLMAVQLTAPEEPNLYCVADGMLYEKLMGRSAGQPLTDTGVAAVGNADYIFGSKKRGTVFALKYGAGGAVNVKHYFNDGLLPASLGGSITAFLTGHEPDCAWYGGEVIVVCNSATGIVRMYSYGGWMREYELKAEEFGAQRIYLNEGLINIVTTGGQIVIYGINQSNGALVRQTAFDAVDYERITGVFAMCDMVAVAVDGSRLDCYRPNIASKNTVWSEVIDYSVSCQFVTYVLSVNAAHKSINITIN